MNKLNFEHCKMHFDQEVLYLIYILAICEHWNNHYFLSFFLIACIGVYKYCKRKWPNTQQYYFFFIAIACIFAQEM